MAGAYLYIALSVSAWLLRPSLCLDLPQSDSVAAVLGCCFSFLVLSSPLFFFFPLLLLSVMSGWLSRRRKAVSSSLCQSVAVVWYRPLVRQIYPFPFQRLCAAGAGSSFKIPSNLLQFLTNFLQFLQNSVSLADPRGSPEFCIKSWNSSGTSCDVS